MKKFIFMVLKTSNMSSYSEFLRFFRMSCLLCVKSHLNILGLGLRFVISSASV